MMEEHKKMIKLTERLNNHLNKMEKDTQIIKENIKDIKKDLEEEAEKMMKLPEELSVIIAGHFGVPLMKLEIQSIIIDYLISKKIMMVK